MFKKKKRNEENKEFQKFSFPTILGILPRHYVTAVYLLALLLAFYFAFLDSGLRKPKVELRFYTLSGPAVLYVDGRLQGNLNGNLNRGHSTVMLPAGALSLRIERDGMKPWLKDGEFEVSWWNNYWNPTSYEIEVKMQPSDKELWQEAWRAYLFRGLEAQKTQSFDDSHPYPWVLGEELRSTVYSGGTVPEYWSADIQRGLAVTSSIYQWGDLLTAASLVAQSRPRKHDPEKTIALLGPKALAALARSGVKRIQRLKPYTHSLASSAERDSPQAQLAEYLNKLQPREQSSSRQPNLELTELGPSSVAFESLGQRFMAVPGSDFAVARDEVSNEQFVRFWFQKFDSSREDGTSEDKIVALAQSLLYAEDRVNAPWDWAIETEGTEAALIDESLEGLPVRGITWREAREFCAWFQEQLPENLQRQWQIQLPSMAQRRELAQILRTSEQAASTPRELDFEIASRPPKFSSLKADALGLRGLSGSLWEWLEDDFLPYPYEASANGYSDLQYKAVAGGSWLNALTVEEDFRDLWVAEFLQQDQELPVAADIGTIAGLFAELRSPFAGFRMVGVRR